MLDKESAIKTIHAYLDDCKRRNLFFQKVILFGSVVKGNTNEFSDIDVALASNQFSGNPIADWHMLSPVNIKFSIVEPHPYTTAYFEKGDPFIDEIKRTGFEITTA